MSDFPNFRWPPLNVITPYHIEAGGIAIRTQNLTLQGAASGALGANVVFYWPFGVFEPTTALKISYIVGATSNGNVDVGIYDWGKNRLVNSGSTAQGTINTLQTVDFTDTVLTTGRYFMALTLSSGTGTVFRATIVDELGQSMAPFYNETTGGFGLPATATLVPSVAGTLLVPAMGVHFDTLV